jgi:hypothetical protein
MSFEVYICQRTLTLNKNLCSKTRFVKSLHISFSKIGTQNISIPVTGKLATQTQAYNLGR